MKAHMKRDHGVSQKMINEQKKGGGNDSISEFKIDLLNQSLHADALNETRVD